MRVPREVIYNTVFAVLQNAYKWNYASRRVLSWDNVNIGQQPAVFLQQNDEVPDQATIRGLTRWILKPHVWIYAQAPANADQPDQSPASIVINPILDAIDSAFASPIPGEKQTLAAYNNGVPLVENCYIDGRIAVADPVAPDQQVVIFIPLTITTGI